MRTWSIYETIFPAVGNRYTEYVGRVEARSYKSALNKAAKEFKVDRGGVPCRWRKPENFTAV